MLELLNTEVVKVASFQEVLTLPENYTGLVVWENELWEMKDGRLETCSM